MMLFSSLSIVIVIVIVIVPRRLLWWSRGMEIHILLLLIIVQWIISHYLIGSRYAPHMGCQRGTFGCGAAAPVRRGEQRGDRWGNIDDWWLHGCLIVVVVRIIIFCRIQIVTATAWTDGIMLFIVSVVLVLEIENVVSDRQTEMYRIKCLIVRLTAQVYLMLSCCGAYFSHFDYPYFLTIPHYSDLT